MIEQFKFLKNYVDQLNKKGGPKEEDYFELDKWTRLAWEYKPTREEVVEIFGPEVTDPKAPSLFSKILNMPRGYNGSFDIMESIYQDVIDPVLTPVQFRWDAFILSQISCLAVRHRADVVKGLSLEYADEHLSFLDVACGSGMAYLTLRNTRPKNLLTYKGIDQESEAIKFCTKKFRSEDFEALPFLGVTQDKLGLSDVVWCSGLFDYIAGDAAFRGAARRLVAVAKKTVIIGNMGPYNPSRPMMELLGWRLIYRTRDKLAELGLKMQNSGSGVKHFEIRTDPTGIQHYLHLTVK